MIFNKYILRRNLNFVESPGGFLKNTVLKPKLLKKIGKTTYSIKSKILLLMSQLIA